MPWTWPHITTLLRSSVAAVTCLTVPVATCDAASLAITIGGSTGAEPVISVSVGTTNPADPHPAPSSPSAPAAPAPATQPPPPSSPTAPSIDVTVPNNPSPAAPPATPAAIGATDTVARLDPSVPRAGVIPSARVLAPAHTASVESTRASGPQRGDTTSPRVGTSGHTPSTRTAPALRTAAVHDQDSGASPPLHRTDPRIASSASTAAPSLVAGAGSAPVAIPASVDVPAIRHRLVDVAIPPSPPSSYRWAMRIERPG